VFACCFARLGASRTSGRWSRASRTEIEEQDNRQLAVLGFAMVSNETHHVKVALGQIVQALRVHPVAELLDHEIEA
jgi:uncharacterized protein YlxP (DUF503 family)